MTWWHAHPDAAEIARRNWKDAELFLIAEREPCLKIRLDELENIERVIVKGAVEELRSWDPRKSWLVAVLLCPGDSTDVLARIVDEEGLEPSRFHFYLAKGTPRSTLKGWAGAGLPLDAVDEDIEDWKALHKLLGIDFNVQIVNDALDIAQR
jgi:hypothetical protein